MPMIEAHNLSKKFGQRLAVDDLTLEVTEGEVLGFLGPNGAGKTTTIRLLSGIIAPTSGSAIVAGLRPDREPEKLHETIGLLTESAGFYDRLTARRNLEYFAGFYTGLQVKPQVEKYLKITGLWERQRERVGTFSKGMKQRLALARALLHEPRVLFLDEPTAGLDPEAAQEVRQMIKKLSSEGRTIFLSTHNLAEAEYLCHRIAVIRNRLLALDTTGDLRQRLFRRRVAVRLEAVPAALPEVIRRLSFVTGITQEGEKLQVDLTDPDRNRPELVKCIVEAGGRVLEVYEEQHSLEEVYLSLMKEDR
jgi:ABC-2 type transport system ATP-binding protein